MFRIMSERISDLEEEACTCFIHWQNTFDHVNWTKSLHILKNISMDWNERNLIRILQYMDQTVAVRLHRGETRLVKI